MIMCMVFYDDFSPQEVFLGLAFIDHNKVLSLWDSHNKISVFWCSSGNFSWLGCHQQIILELFDFHLLIFFTSPFSWR